MKKHKWRRRLFFLVFLFVVGAIILTPDGKSKDYTADASKSEETIVSWMIDRIASGEVELSDEENIRQALLQAEQEVGVSLTEENKDRVVGFLKTIGTVEVETEGFIDQAKEKYKTYSEDFVEEANEAINEAVEGAVTSAARNFVDSIRQAAGDFLKNLIPE